MKLSLPYLVAKYISRVKFCRLFPSKVGPKIGSKPLTLTLVPDPSLPKVTCVFTKDLKQLAADLEATNDGAAVVQRYKDTLVAKGEVCCEFWSFLVLSCSHVSKFTHLMERLERIEKADREAAPRAARDGRVDQ